MKTNWHAKKLGEICKVIAGQSPEGRFYNKSGEGLPFYQGKKDFGEKFIEEPTVWTTQVTKEAEKGDILMSVRAPVGPTNFATENICIGRGLAAIRAGEEIDKDFLFYFFKMFEDQLIGNSGAVFNSINKTQIENIEIPLPPLSEQRRIVKILDEAFEKLEKAKENTENNLQNSRGLFESYLNGIFSSPSKDWEHGTVSSFVEQGYISKPQDGNHGEIHPHRSDYVSDGVPFIMACDLINGRVDQINSKFISEKLAKSLRIGFAKNEDVLLSHKGTIGRVAILETDKPFVILTPQITYYRILDKSKIYNKFLYYYFLSNRFHGEMQKIAGKGSTRAYIGITKQEELSLLIPSLTEQKQIVKKLDQLSEKTKKLESLYKQKLENIEELKKSILQKAFSGGL